MCRCMESSSSEKAGRKAPVGDIVETFCKHLENDVTSGKEQIFGLSGA